LPFCHARLKGPRPLPRSYPQVLLTIGDHLRKRRLDLGLLQREVATQVGVDTATVTNWELNRTIPELRFFPGIVRFLGYAPRAEPLTLADRIHAARMIRGLSQRKVADMLNLDPGTIAKYERGLREPQGKQLDKILRFVQPDSGLERL
jgi:transcriptional regulator with XRE-family HTH domain